MFDLKSLDVLRQNDEIIEEEDPSCTTLFFYHLIRTGPPNSFKIINKYGRTILILCALSPEERDEWVSEFK
jgi:hypothetical protein